MKKYFLIATMLFISSSANAVIDCSLKNQRQLDLGLKNAALSGHLYLVKGYFDCGASLFAASPSGDTALHEAVRSRRLEVVTFLVEKGADVNLADKAGRRPIDLDIITPEIKEYLLARETVKPNNPLDDSSIPVIAKKTERQKLSEYVCDKYKERQQWSLDSGLTTAVIFQRTDDVGELLACGANPNAEEYAGRTLLHEAAKRGNETIVMLLVEGKADVNALDDEGNTASDLAQKTKIRDFLQSRECPEIRNRERTEKKFDCTDYPQGKLNSELHSAVTFNKFDRAVELLKCGADTDYIWAGKTVLQNAAERGHFEIVKLLVVNGADLTIRASEAAKTREIKEYLEMKENGI